MKNKPYFPMFIDLSDKNIVGMDKLKEHGFYEAVLDGMDACTKRAEELGK